jgi:hypothetical protein
MALEIALSNGMWATIDEDDFFLVMYRPDGRMRNWHFDGRYATANEGGRGQKIYLHRLIAGISDSKVHVDHWNENGLDCRRRNLKPTGVSDHHRRHVEKLHTPEAHRRSVESRKRNGRANYFGRG